MKFIGVFSLIVGLVAGGCGKEQPASASSADTHTAQATGAPAGTATATPTLVANNYTGGEYVAGVAEAGTEGFFYFLIPHEASVPVKLGTKLNFEKTGVATVTKIDIAEQGTQKAVFVHVDKKLNAAGDGFPHPIRIQSN